MKNQEKQKINGAQSGQNPNKKTSTVAVFWIEDGEPCVSVSSGSSIGHALDLCENLRTKAKSGAAISNVCISSDSVDNVTLPGCNDKLPVDYNWTKRRHVFAPGRHSGSTVPAESAE